jgi:hypothetical protein
LPPLLLLLQNTLTATHHMLHALTALHARCPFFSHIPAGLVELAAAVAVTAALTAVDAGSNHTSCPQPLPLPPLPLLLLWWTQPHTLLQDPAAAHTSCT